MFQQLHRQSSSEVRWWTQTFSLPQSRLCRTSSARFDRWLWLRRLCDRQSFRTNIDRKDVRERYNDFAGLCDVLCWLYVGPSSFCAFFSKSIRYQTSLVLACDGNYSFLSYTFLPNTPQKKGWLTFFGRYFGTEYARECFCGNVLTAGATTVATTQCSKTCTGNSAQLCGNGDRLSLYKLAPPV